MTFSNKPKIHPGQVSKALDSLRKSPPGTHCLVVYPDLMTLRGIYSHYTKTQLEDSNQMVLILPYYETTDMVRLALSGRDAYDDNGNNPFGYSGMDTSKHEKDGSLIIMDSLKGYFPSKQSSHHEYDDNPKAGLDFMSFLDILLKQADRRGKDGVAVLSDLGSFYHHHIYGKQKLVEYERSLPKKFDGKNLKGFCLYHQRDYERYFTQEQQGSLLAYHSQNIISENVY
jgi:hypothetical protein